MIYPQKNKFNFDAGLRYYPVVKKIEKLGTNKVLEIGSGVNGISDFYSGEVVGVDSDFSKTESMKNINMTHKRGNILKLPEQDNSYQYVVCLDTFEHIPEEIRKKAVNELFRVTKKGGYIFLGFPSGDKSSKYESYLNYFYKRKYKKDYFWLKEHKENGLPSKASIKEFILTRKPVSLEIINNVNLNVWLLVHTLLVIYSGLFVSRVLRFFYKQVFKLLTYLNFGTCYRIIFIIKK